MKKNTRKKLLTGSLLLVGGLFLASCTANFCSSTDQAAMAYPYDQGVTVYVSKAEFEALKTQESTKGIIEQELKWSEEAKAYGLPAIAGPAFGDKNDDVYKYIPFSPKMKSTTDGEGNVEESLDLTKDGSLKVEDYTAKKYVSSVLSSVISQAKSNGYMTPSIYYFGLLDDYALKASIIETDTTGVYGDGKYTSVSDWDAYIADPSGSAFVGALKATAESSEGTSWVVNPYTVSDTNGEDGESVEYSVLRQNGRLKFSGAAHVDDNGGSNREMWEFFSMWNEDLSENYVDKVVDGKTFSMLDRYAMPSSDFESLYRNGINNQVYNLRSCIATRPGEYGHYGPNADWRVPMEEKTWGYAWSKGFLEGLLVYPVSWLTDTFAIGMDPLLSGVGQIWAIIFVTLIVRCLMLLVSLRSTIDQQKMQAIQPELAKIQAKYPNSNENQAERQRLGQEQMALYKRYGIRPFRQILVMIVQFPVFICVWSGLQGSAALATGEFLNMSLSDPINQILFNVSGTWYLNTHGWWTALVLFILMSGIQILAMLTPRIFQKIQTKNMPKTVVNKAANQQNKSMKIMTVVMTIFTIIMGFMLPSAMGVYWLIGGLIQVAQTVITQLVLMKKKRKGNK